MAKKRIILLGATGSIGENTLRVITAHSDKLELVGVAARSNHAKLAEIARKFSVRHVALCDDEAFKKAQPTLAAIAAHKTIALANKETLVLGGKFVMKAAQAAGVEILPIDSEHNAVFQCLHGRTSTGVKRVILTASGGAFRNLPRASLATVTPADALKHPNWSMGPKVTVDSATLANKGLELIEAQWLFDLREDQLDAVLHPPSLVHALVEFTDGAVVAELSPPSMTFPIQHALLYPQRAPGVEKGLDFSQAMNLDFRPIDEIRYPCFALAKAAMKSGGIAPAVFNAANEIAVAAFLAGQVPFLAISEIIDRTLGVIPNYEPTSLEAVIASDQQARTISDSLLGAAASPR